MLGDLKPFEIAWLPEFDDDVLFTTAVHLLPAMLHGRELQSSSRAYMIVSRSQ